MIGMVHISELIEIISQAENRVDRISLDVFSGEIYIGKRILQYRIRSHFYRSIPKTKTNNIRSIWFLTTLMFSTSS